MTAADVAGARRTERDFLHERRTDLFATVLLSLATVTSAWSAYQSSRWSGAQAIRFSEANAARVQAAAKRESAVQVENFDAVMFIDYAAAISSGDKRLSDFLFKRFRPEMKKALDAWLATDPLKNPDAPGSPFEMKAYSLHLREEAASLDRRAEDRVERAKTANQNSDNYVLLTVLFASVLFFAGIGAKFWSLRLRVAVLVIGAVLFLVAAGVLSTYPIK